MLNLEFWEKEWPVIDGAPHIAIGGAITLIVVTAVFVWWLRGHIAKERIATLEERLRLAGDEQQAVTREVDRLQTLIPQLPQASTTALVAQSVNTLSTANDHLVGPGKHLVMKSNNL